MTRVARRVGILGAGRQAHETLGYLQAHGLSPTFCVVDPAYAAQASELGLEVRLTSEDLDALADTPVITAVGSPALKSAFVRCWPGAQFITLVAAEAWTATDIVIGDGTYVGPGALINRHVRIGRHVSINIGATVSHDTTIGDFSTLSPGCHLAGQVRVGPGVLVGIGAVVSDGLSVGEGAIIGAGAVVVEDVPENTVVVGNPARKLRDDFTWSTRIREPS
jgi:sugar O-acyltransferase (sialic acid O-acetyltransferase NeuD family)